MSAVRPAGPGGDAALSDWELMGLAIEEARAAPAHAAARDGVADVSG